MKLGLDIHGVIDFKPEIFSFMSKSVIASGGEVHIVTGGTWNDELRNLVEESGIVYTHFFSVYDHLIEIGAEKIGVIQFPDGTKQKKFDGDLWDSIKGEYCFKMGIDLHIDDTEIYSNYFKTPFLLFKSGDDVIKLSHIEIFSDVLKKI